MGTIAEIRTGLQTRLETISSLNNRVYKRWPGSINPPCAIIKRTQGPKRTTFSGAAGMTFEITVAVQLSDFERAQEALDGYTDISGASSIIAALEADETLGGKAEYLLIGEWNEDNTGQIGGVEYGIAKLPVEVHTAI